MTTTADQERLDRSLITSHDKHKSRGSPHPSTDFIFLCLPIELRLKIYGYLLPPRRHIIVTKIQNTGLFYNTSTSPTIGENYPFGRNTPVQETKYQVLSSNWNRGFPQASIYPELFRVCKQVHREAEPVLYSNIHSIFDFGLHGEALISFWNQRSRTARASAKRLGIAKEIPCITEADGMGIATVDKKWKRLCDFIKNEMTGLRELDLKLWTGNENWFLLPFTPLSSPESQIVASEPVSESASSWKTFEWTKALLELDSLRSARVTAWEFHNRRGQEGEKVGFDSWLAGRMVGDSLVKDRMVKEGVVIERSVVLSGKAG
ncbi:hypothetical protein BJ875DRAFT_282066 [Amylocarpus encephaloides]|uniref:DUF7730 domain-containing protein n=1 Tax=Amylocarpus encephaloides TaxID=45428 RepID=A0A9P8C600_9HELO|nr:hypothetical protein BJ875DRAFT_282066 [Amylocarpus encephaloides]